MDKLNRALVGYPDFDFRGKVRVYFLGKNFGRIMSSTIIR